MRAHSDALTSAACLPASQLYVVLVLAHGGTDVEGVKLSTWTQAASVFWQVADSLARAELACQFEHRDLHWGNVLVSFPATASVDAATNKKGGRASKMITSPVSPLRRRARLSASKQVAPSGSTFAKPSAGLVERLLDTQKSGVRATIIDLSLSRAVCEEEEVLAYAFEDDSIFQGEGELQPGAPGLTVELIRRIYAATGDEQFDVYRQMRDHVDGEWQKHHPLTNLMASLK